MAIRVAHLLDGRHFGGAEQMVRLLMRRSAAHGIDARAYLLSEGRLAEFLRAEGLPVRVFPARGRFDPRPLGAIARAAREDGVQILQAHTSRTHLMARMLSRRLGIPNITVIHSPIALDENIATRRHTVRAWIERAGRRWTDRICPVSREEAERIIWEEGCPREKVVWIPNGVERVEEADLAGAANSDADSQATEQIERGVRSSAFQADVGLQARPTNAVNRSGELESGRQEATPPEFTVAMIAQLRPRKGGEVLIRAFGEFVRRGGAGRLIIIGDDEFTRGAGHGRPARISETDTESLASSSKTQCGTVALGCDSETEAGGYMDTLRSLAAEQGSAAAARIEFAGFQPDPWSLASRADAICLPSLFGEGLPLTLLEAMNRARAIFASDIPGNRECVEDGATGRLHPAGDWRALASQLAAASADRAGLAAMGRRGRERFLERFDLEKVLPRWVELYTATISKTRGATIE